jgi:uncharacterized protein YxeA
MSFQDILTVFLGITTSVLTVYAAVLNKRNNTLQKENNYLQKKNLEMQIEKDNLQKIPMFIYDNNLSFQFNYMFSITNNRGTAKNLRISEDPMKLMKGTTNYNIVKNSEKVNLSLSKDVGRNYQIKIEFNDIDGKKYFQLILIDIALSKIEVTETELIH